MKAWAPMLLAGVLLPPATHSANLGGHATALTAANPEYAALYLAGTPGGVAALRQEPCLSLATNALLAAPRQPGQGPFVPPTAQ